MMMQFALTVFAGHGTALPTPAIRKILKKKSFDTIASGKMEAMPVPAFRLKIMMVNRTAGQDNHLRLL
jgi:hypothetical protein